MDGTLCQQFHGKKKQKNCFRYSKGTEFTLMEIGRGEKTIIIEKYMFIKLITSHCLLFISVFSVFCSRVACTERNLIVQFIHKDEL